MKLPSAEKGRLKLIKTNASASKVANKISQSYSGSSPGTQVPASPKRNPPPAPHALKLSLKPDNTNLMEQ
jgi:hypothetical protein